MNPKNREIAKALQQVNDDLGMKDDANELAHLTEDIEPSERSAFAAASGTAFEQGKEGGVQIDFILVLNIFGRSCLHAEWH